MEKGDIYAFIGHNGAGKTTLLKSITGIHDFDKGEVIIDGINLREQPLEVKKHIAYVPDNPDIYEFMTGIQYLNFIADLFEVSVTDREQRIADYAGRFEITSSLGELISSYSHGMKQKLVLICPAALIVFSVVFGLFINLCFPKFQWESDMEVVKQSATCGISILGIFVAIIPALSLSVLPEDLVPLVSLIFISVISAVTYLLYRRIIRSVLPE